MSRRDMREGDAIRKIMLVFVSLALFSALPLVAAPLSANEAMVILQDLARWQDESGALKWIENLTIGDTVTLLGKAAKFKQDGKEHDFVRVRPRTARRAGPGCPTWFPRRPWPW